VSTDQKQPQEELRLEAESQQSSPVAQTTADAAPGQSDTPLIGQDVLAQGTSGSVTRAEEEAKPAENQLGLNETSEFTKIEPVDMESAVERAVLGHGEYFGRGYVQNQEDVGFQPSETHDLVRRGEQIYFSVIRWQGSTPTLTIYPDGINFRGKPIVFPQLPPALYKSILLPTDVGVHYAAREVFDNILTLLKRLPLLSERECQLLTFWCIASWFPDVLHFIPRLTITGPKYAADLLFRMLRTVCRRPVLLAGMNPAVLKLIPISELLPTLFILETSLNKRVADLLNGLDQDGYLVASGGQMRECYCVKCIYLGEEYAQISDLDGIHVHLSRNASLPDRLIPSDSTVETLQNQLLTYRTFNLDRVRASEFTANDLVPQFDAMARQLGSAILDDFVLQELVVEGLKDLSEQARVDRGSSLKSVVVRAVLSHCHSDQQRVFTHQIATTVNDIYREEGESLKVRSETVGHVLKNLGLYSRRLGSEGRGLVLDTSTQLRAHALSLSYEVLPEAPACGHCQEVQMQQERPLM